MVDGHVTECHFTFMKISLLIFVKDKITLFSRQMHFLDTKQNVK